MKIGSGHEHSRELFEQEAGDLVLFNVNPNRIVESAMPALAR